jgi:large subunit ribosomal protein L30
MSAERYFSVKLKRSGAGWSDHTRRILTGLGLSRMGRTVHLKDTPAVRGMLYKVVHLVEVEPHSGTHPATSARARVRQEKRGE